MMAARTQFDREGTVKKAAKRLGCSEITVKRGLAAMKAAKETKDVEPA